MHLINFGCVLFDIYFGSYIAGYVNLILLKQFNFGCILGNKN